MAAVHTTGFKSNKMQAVRMPKAMVLPESVKEVDIIAVGKLELLYQQVNHEISGLREKVPLMILWMSVSSLSKRVASPLIC